MEPPLPEELFIQAEEQSHAELFLLRLEHALRCLTSPQAYRVHAHFFLGKRYVEIARDEGVTSTGVARSIGGAIKAIFQATKMGGFLFMKSIKSLEEQQRPVQEEIKGIATDKGNINREIVTQNKLLKEMKARVTRLHNWSKENEKQPEKASI